MRSSSSTSPQLCYLHDQEAMGNTKYIFIKFLAVSEMKNYLSDSLHDLTEAGHSTQVSLQRNSSHESTNEACRHSLLSLCIMSMAVVHKNSKSPQREAESLECAHECESRSI